MRNKNQTTNQSAHVLITHTLFSCVCVCGMFPKSYRDSSIILVPRTLFSSTHRGKRKERACTNAAMFAVGYAYKISFAIINCHINSSPQYCGRLQQRPEKSRKIFPHFVSTGGAMPTIHRHRQKKKKLKLKLEKKQIRHGEGTPPR